MPNEQLAAIPALWFHEGSGGALLSRIKQGFMDHLSRLYGLMWVCLKTEYPKSQNPMVHHQFPYKIGWLNPNIIEL